MGKRDNGRFQACRFAATILLMVVGGGCSMLNSFLDPTTLGSFPAEYREGGVRRVLTPRDAPPGRPDATEPTADDLVPVFEEYRLGPKDELGLVIEDLINPGNAFTNVTEISPTGYIRIPYLGSLKVSGMTEQELEQEIEARLKEAQLLPNPVVQVFVRIRRNEYFTVLGSVAQAGTYQIGQPDMRLLDVLGIVRAGAPDVKRMYVIRRSEGAGGTPQAAPPGEGAPAPRAPEELIIPPPDEDFSGASNSFLSRNGMGTGSGQQDKPLSPATQELDQAISPSRRGQDEPSATAPAEERAFRPLIFDPDTGRPTEAQPQQQRIPPPAEAIPPQPKADLPLEGFDWDEVPELPLTQRVIEIDVQALRRGDPRFNIVVRNRDVMEVPVDTGVFYLMGEINRPGVYSFNNRDITLKQAIAIGAGLTPLGWPQRCEIIRQEKGTDKQITIPVNVDAIFAGLEDDVYLRDNDLVNVGTHPVAPFLFVIRNSFRFTYGFGFVYDRNFADKDAYGSRINPDILEQQRRSNRGLPF